jgi:SPX domain protein involved in polyphosphate accumulation
MLSADLRYDLKMVFDALRLAEVRSWVFAHSYAFRKAFPYRYVNNIYFDTPQWDMLGAHLDGEEKRAKVRYRWHGQTWSPSQGQIELKHKQGNLGYKKQQSLFGGLILDKRNWTEIIQQLKDQVDAEFQDLFDVFFPVLVNRYRREYYVSADKTVRITLDYKMEVFMQIFSSKPNIKHEDILRNNVVIEIKAEQAYHQKIVNVLAELPLYSQQHSKYLNGLEYLWA